MTTYNKLLFAGPVGAGKTTAINAISDSAPLSTEAPLSGGPMGEKTTTTVALDYSYLRLGNDIVHLYGVPGQERLKFMRELLVSGAIGAVLLLDASRKNINADAESWLQSLTGLSQDLRFVVGVTKTDQAENFSLNGLRQVVGQFSRSIPILSVDAREAESVKQLLRLMLV